MVQQKMEEGDDLVLMKTIFVMTGQALTVRFDLLLEGKGNLDTRIQLKAPNQKV